ncbi:hypothetical protein VFPPC_17841 [Pochonia chlamydosporia 170]|uniref:Uncharacterized protein n=1 Tax=Pochonia chlamydosporia 170 TaxID=1380566 RepID=A0A219AQA7_METCM|nr:hypothetical protein VFPPC_17841 [Pochonia chlamydosporia 170]OWT42966.1 hypothetical protein VFPPC_17841 [Pochonia chlamydosporia 170]
MAAGHALIKSSLILQVFVLGSFIVLAYTYHRRCRANGIRSPKLRGPLLTLYASSALLAVRTTYRIVEYFSIAELKYNKPNFNPMSMSPIVRYEWYFYVFEAGAMICNCGLFNICHPRRYLPKNSKIYLAKDGITETQGPGFKDARPLWKTLIDPFNIIGLFKSRDQDDRSWLPDIEDNLTTNDKLAYDKSTV